SCQKACNGATPQPYELNTAINCRDEVVSPLLPLEGEEPSPAQPASRSTALPCPSSSSFQYGNYCKYYGYRNPDCEDVRLRALKPEWFRGREVLDVGCNVGHLSLSVAKKWAPARLVGLDIDGALIHSARQNIRHYLSEEQQRPQDSQGDREGAKKTFPASLTASRGPIAAPRVPQDGVDATLFPNNVIFVK
ncbi:hypothetical protein L345_17744, partial [Ophiophagus hannah]